MRFVTYKHVMICAGKNMSTYAYISQYDLIRTRKTTTTSQLHYHFQLFIFSAHQG